MSKTTPSKIEAGQSGETSACRYLERQGLTLVERNFRCRAGELDLIMRDGRQLVFVEVRSHHASRYATPAESVTPRKQRRLIHAALYYLQQRRIDAPCRFDVIAITQSQGESRLQWIKDAFQAD